MGVGVGVGKGTKAIHPAKQHLIGKPRFHDIFTILLLNIEKNSHEAVTGAFCYTSKFYDWLSRPIESKNGECTSILDSRRPIASD